MQSSSSKEVAVYAIHGDGRSQSGYKFIIGKEIEIGDTIRFFKNGIFVDEVVEKLVTAGRNTFAIETTNTILGNPSTITQMGNKKPNIDDLNCISGFGAGHIPMRIQFFLPPATAASSAPPLLPPRLELPGLPPPWLHPLQPPPQPTNVSWGSKGAPKIAVTAQAAPPPPTGAYNPFPGGRGKLRRRSSSCRRSWRAGETTTRRKRFIKK